MVKNKNLSGEKVAADPKAVESLPESGADGSGWLENFIYLLIISILFIGIYTYIFDKKLDLNGDNAYYYVLGKALFTGEGYVNIATVDKVPNNHFPPGYPFLISLLMHFSDSVVFLKMMNGLLLLMSLLIIYFLFRQLTGNLKIAFVGTLLLTLNVHFLQYGTMMMSEIPFIFFTMLGILFFYKMDDEKNIFRKPSLYIVLLSLIASYYIRSTGLALLGGVLLYLAIRKRWKPFAFLFSGFTLAALPWIIRSQKLGGSSYIKPLVMINPYRPELGNASFGDYFNRLLDNFSRYITREIPNAALPFYSVDYLEKISLMEWILGLTLLAISVYGFYLFWKKGLFILFYLAGTFAILLLWPEVWRGVRFVLPVTPFLLLSIIIGIYYLFNHLISNLNFRFNILVLALAGIAFIGPIKSLHDIAVKDHYKTWKNYFQTANYFKREKIQNVVVVCRKPMLYHLESGTYTVNFAYLDDEQEMLDDLKAKNASYVVLDNLGYRQTFQYLFPVIRENPDKFEIVLALQDPDTFLFKFNPDK